LNIRDFFRENSDLVFLENCELPETTCLCAQSRARKSATEVTATRSTLVTATTDDGGHDGNAIANFDGLHCRAHLNDAGRKLVTKRLRKRNPGEGVRGGRSDNRTDDIFVEVSSANSAVERLNEYFVIELNPRIFYLFDANVFFAVIACGFHAIPFCF
jgi:hypothetical protein